jgi:Zn-dependent protease
MGRSCSSCGFRSENLAVFRREKGEAFGFGRWFCFGCRPFPRVRPGIATLVVAGGLALLGWWGVAADTGFEIGGGVLLLLAGWILGTPLTLAVHELGHAAVASLIGRRVYRICIGSGPMLATFDTGHTQWFIGRDMSMGHVIQIPLGRSSRRGDLAVLAAGATANLIMVILLLRVADRLSDGFDAAAALVGGLVLSNLFTCAAALIPGSHLRDGQSWASDGRQIFQTLRRKGPTLDWDATHAAYEGAALARSGRWEEAEACYRGALARQADEPGLVGALLHVVAYSKGKEAARLCAAEFDRFLRREREREQKREVTGRTAQPWSYAWGMAAWSHIRVPSGDLSAAALFSGKALEAGALPHSRAVEGARLTRTGDREKGLSEILETLKTLDNPGDRLEFCDFIMAEGLETPDLKTSDFQSYAAHLRGGNRKLWSG